LDAVRAGEVIEYMALKYAEMRWRFQPANARRPRARRVRALPTIRLGSCRREKGTSGAHPRSTLSAAASAQLSNTAIAPTMRMRR